MKRKARKAKRDDGSAVVFALYEAVQSYVESRGGSVVVAGGIEFQEWPGDMGHQFRVAIRCTGSKPTLMLERHGRRVAKGGGK